MVLVRNKKQNTIWDITDPAHLKRLLADKNYEEVKPDTKKPEKSG